MSFKVYAHRLISRSGKSLLNIDLILGDNNDYSSALLMGCDTDARSYPINVIKIKLVGSRALKFCTKKINDYCDLHKRQEFCYRGDFPEPGGSGKNELFFDDLISLQRDYLLAPLIDQKHFNERIYDRLSKKDRLFFGLPSNTEQLDNSTLLKEWRECKKTAKDELLNTYVNNPLFGRF